MAKSLAMIFFSISVAVAGQLLLKSGMNEVGPISIAQVRSAGATAMTVVTNGRVVGGLALYGFSAIVWLIVLSRVNLSFAYPLIGSSYIIVMLLSRLLFGEHISPVRWAGAAFISLGVVLVSRQ